jgi:hypothetical protein
MKKKKKITIVIAVLFFLILLLTPAFIFLRMVAIFQPFEVGITGITPQEAGLIEINGVTPVNRKIKVTYDKNIDK